MTNHIDGCRLPHVVGAGLERKAEHGDPSLGKLAVERALNLGDETAACLLIDLNRRAEQEKALPVIAGRLVQRAHILGEAGPAEPEARTEERASDALVGADAVGDRAESAPVNSQSCAISLMNEIFSARNALTPYLMSSALVESVIRSGASR